MLEFSLSLPFRFARELSSSLHPERCLGWAKMLHLLAVVVQLPQLV